MTPEWYTAKTEQYAAFAREHGAEVVYHVDRNGRIEVMKFDGCVGSES